MQKLKLFPGKRYIRYILQCTVCENPEALRHKIWPWEAVEEESDTESCQDFEALQ